VKADWSLRFGAVMVPTVRNGAVFDTDIAHASSEALEFEKPYKLGNQSGKIRLLAFLTQAQMGNYSKAIEWGIANNSAPNLDAFHAWGRTKYGFGINAEHTFNENVGAFARASWNDGQNETWTFTEIDRHASAGVVLNGNLWNRKEDKLGIAQIVDGISKPHQDYLKAGGYGFIIGDGKLNYGLECVSEIYYSFKVPNVNIWLSPDYQLVINPAYNKDRGPVHAFGIRFHAEI
jgi:Carbohydrate-selective porin